MIEDKSVAVRRIGPHNNISIMLIDVRPLTRHCIASLLRGAERGLRVYELAGPNDAVLAAPELPGVDLILLNLGSNRVTEDPSISALDLIRTMIPDVPIIVLSHHADATHALNAIRLGARGHIPITSSLALMLAALRLVLAGGIYVAPLEANPTRADDAGPRHLTLPTIPTGATAGAPSRRMRNELTNREGEVLRLLRQGKANKVIAYELNMSENTVKVHVRRLMRKLNVMNRTEAAFASHMHGTTLPRTIIL